jgi:hypothetical protein
MDFAVYEDWLGSGVWLTRNRAASAAEQDVLMEFYGLPPIGQKRPMDGAQFHSPPVGEAGGRLKRK